MKSASTVGIQCPFQTACRRCIASHSHTDSPLLAEPDSVHSTTPLPTPSTSPYPIPLHGVREDIDSLISALCTPDTLPLALSPSISSLLSITISILMLISISMSTESESPSLCAVSCSDSQSAARHSFHRQSADSNRHRRRRWK